LYSVVYLCICNIVVNNLCSTTLPCKNGASCTDLPDNYTCTCDYGYEGKTCEACKLTISKKGQKSIYTLLEEILYGNKIYDICYLLILHVSAAQEIISYW
jgi:hypothetical protein